MQVKSIFPTSPWKKQVQPSTDLKKRYKSEYLVYLTDLRVSTEFNFLSKDILSQSKWKLGPYKFVNSTNMAIASMVLLAQDSTQRTVVRTLIVTTHYAH